MNFEVIQNGVGSLMVAATTAFASLLPVAPLPSEPLPLEQSVLVESSNLALQTEEELGSESSFQLTSHTLEEDKASGEEIKQVGQIEIEETVPLEEEEIIGVMESYGPTISEVTPEPTTAPVKVKQTEKVVELKESPRSTPDPSTAPTPTPSPISSPVVTPSNRNSLNAELIFQMINNHRVSIGKPAFEKDERLCKIAKERVPQLQNEIFGGGVMHAGLKAMNLPFWNTENMAGYQTEKQTFDWWMSDYIHRVAIESDHKYSCGACLGNTCAQEFSSFVPKG